MTTQAEHPPDVNTDVVSTYDLEGDILAKIAGYLTPQGMADALAFGLSPEHFQTTLFKKVFMALLDSHQLDGDSDLFVEIMSLKEQQLITDDQFKIVKKIADAHSTPTGLRKLVHDLIRATNAKRRADLLRRAGLHYVDGKHQEADRLRAKAQELRDPGQEDKAEKIAASVFYDGTRYYWHHGDKFVSMDISSLRRHLKRAGVRASKDDTEIQSQLDELICQIQLDNSVEFAGPMAGHGIGKHGRGDGDFLVTRPPCFIEAESGDCGHILRFLEGLLGMEQAEHFVYWLRASMMNLEAYSVGEAQYRPAPAIVLAGPRDCGKTFLVALLAKLFGRAQSANLWLSGGSEFNSDLAGSELLTVDDDIGLADGKTRSQISAKIKGALFSGDVKIHPKGKQAFSARPFWRIVYAVNDEPEAMMVLPKLDASMEDKLALFQCYKSELPLAELSRTEREQAYTDQLPAFVEYLHKVKVDPEMEATRSGCYCWQSPELLDALNQLSPEHKMLALIDDAFGGDLPFEGTAREIESRLKGDGATANETSRLLTYPNRAGLYLSRLASSAPNRVQKSKKTDNVQYYKIIP